MSKWENCRVTRVRASSTNFTPVACKVVQLFFLMHFLNKFVLPFLFTKLLNEMSEKNFLRLNSSYTCILRVFYVSIDTSLTNFCGQKNVVLTLNLCNFTLRLALGIYKKFSNKKAINETRIFLVFFTFQLTPVSQTFLDRKTLFQH